MGSARGQARKPDVNDKRRAFMQISGRPEDVAQAAVFLAPQMSNFATGAVIDVNGEIV
ncbi:MAG: SDR family oxidoreductase [Deltaproteobacteria bacterium]